MFKVNFIYIKKTIYIIAFLIGLSSVFTHGFDTPFSYATSMASSSDISSENIERIAHSPPYANMEALKNTGRAKVTNIINPYIVELDDGRTIWLSGLYSPDYTLQDAGDGTGSGDIAVLATQILRDMLLGQTVDIYQTRKADWGRRNRMGHHIAHIVRHKDSTWVQGMMLRLGLASVKTGLRTPELANAMYAYETLARKETLGMWVRPELAIYTADELTSLGEDGREDGFIIVEGVVKSTALKSNTIYINFGNDWKTDFTVSIAPEHKRAFSKAQLNPLDWSGQKLRVRGWVREYNGAFMELTHPQSIEFLE